MIRCPQHAHEP